MSNVAVPREGAGSSSKPSCCNEAVLMVTTSGLKGPAALLWDSCGGVRADLGGSNFL